MNFWSIVKAPFFGQFRQPWQWPTAYDKIERWQQITIKSASGATLKGLFGVAEAETVRGNIVCAHPMGVGARRTVPLYHRPPVSPLYQRTL